MITQNPECGICLCPTVEGMMMPCCQSCFCKVCLDQAFAKKKQCPTCRKVLTDIMPFPIHRIIHHLTESEGASKTPVDIISIEKNSEPQQHSNSTPAIEGASAGENKVSSKPPNDPFLDYAIALSLGEAPFDPDELDSKREPKCAKKIVQTMKSGMKVATAPSKLDLKSVKTPEELEKLIF
ncbi:uncharacterized protein MONOS_9418 [Monocercomonoides exilis]|uniref:uncharacterized protein n=1 Tax=Monocercomonoides exilis TaxID=2049356 RepID=UPI003559CF7E|nr:hypothetical protein MONOS_9418 [Monocercomonoides exilis]|eukprot:MONOS_9418.1-p1 / transcript=MONOS_9418.1 / gene=MONOS_9418 / organism=Monocercomonoides_exilis_PA203 / gene_product=unspecified product / transcript_product=unspecified product / location=Mono_scaffold00388:40107-40718(-) / protein_length=181 / sequence_SO=supercontig / SO=protein_coding / is_pseudo=false